MKRIKKICHGFLAKLGFPYNTFPSFLCDRIGENSVEIDLTYFGRNLKQCWFESISSWFIHMTKINKHPFTIRKDLICYFKLERIYIKA